MLSKLNFEDRIKQELTAKAGEVEISDLMLCRITNRIENDAEENKSMLIGKFQSTLIKKWIAVSICAVLVIGGVMFTFSSDVRAATLSIMDTIKTIFVLDKSQGEYQIVEKTTEDPIFSPVICKTTTLSDAELTNKMGFNFSFPKTLYGEYQLEEKVAGVGINKKVNLEVTEQLELDMLKAIDNEAAFNSLSQYNPYRSIGGLYNKEDNTIFIDIYTADRSAPLWNEDAVTILETFVGDEKAVWIEVVYANYKHIDTNGVGKSDFYSEPNGISTSHMLTWNCNGVRYAIGTVFQSELTMEEAVKIAEAFMAAQ